MLSSGNSFGCPPPDAAGKPPGLGVLFRVLTGGPVTAMPARP